MQAQRFDCTRIIQRAAVDGIEVVKAHQCELSARIRTTSGYQAKSLTQNVSKVVLRRATIPDYPRFDKSS